MKYPKAILLTIALGVLVHTAIALVPGRIMMPIFVIMAWVFIIGFLLVGYGTLVQNGWGINLKPVICPSCNCEMARVREPKSLREALWGGGTCVNCGCEIDKWGRRITTSR
jgi:hypothetical protein